jgi:hypothetical protein
MHTVWKSFPLLHKVVLHYKIIPSCNTWHTSIASGVIKQLVTPKTLLCYFARKVHIFATFFRYSPCCLGGQKTESVEIQERLERKFFVLYISAKPFHCNCKKILPVLWSQPNACIVAEIQGAFSFLWVHSEFEYCSFISSYNGNEMSFGRWWNWKAAEVEEMWRGSVHSGVLWGVPYKAAIQLD